MEGFETLEIVVTVGTILFGGFVYHVNHRLSSKTKQLQEIRDDIKNIKMFISTENFSAS